MDKHNNSSAQNNVYGRVHNLTTSMTQKFGDMEMWMIV